MNSQDLLPVRVVTLSRFDEFEKRFARLVNIAKKIDVEAPSFKIVREDTQPRPAQSDLDRQRIAERDPTYPREVIFYVEIAGEAPQVPGFRFVGKIEPSHVEGFNFVSGVLSGELDLTSFASAAIECEHCETRRSRKAAYLIESTETGKIFKVGRNCLKDFTGHSSPESCASFLELFVGIFGDDWSECRGERVEPAWSLLGFVQMTAAVVEDFGWAAAATAAEAGASTKSTVIDALEQSGPFSEIIEKSRRLEIPTITDAHKELAAEAIAWVRTLSPDPVENTSDYLRNLRLAVEPCYVVEKRAGLVASIFRALTNKKQRELQMADRVAAKAKRDTQDAVASPIPTFAGRVRIEGTIVHAVWKATDFGDVLKIIVRHADGWKVWGSAPKAIEVPESEMIGLAISFDARIKVSSNDPNFGFFSRPTRVTV